MIHAVPFNIDLRQAENINVMMAYSFAEEFVFDVRGTSWETVDIDGGDAEGSRGSGMSNVVAPSIVRQLDRVVVLLYMSNFSLVTTTIRGRSIM